MAAPLTAERRPAALRCRIRTGRALIFVRPIGNLAPPA